MVLLRIIFLQLGYIFKLYSVAPLFVMFVLTLDVSQLQDESALVELSIIAGNDFTGPFSRQLKMSLGLPERAHVTEMADWIQHHKCVENHPAAADMMVGTLMSPPSSC